MALGLDLGAKQFMAEPGSLVVYKEKDSDTAPHFWTVEGNNSHSVQLTGLGKYVLYEIQVLAFTRIGDGRSSSPPILERTLDDGKHDKPDIT
ncbi:Protein sidekick-2 [Xenoophorus captivus]|uniref:Protein sidekick-2 n=1 Tax=Xenoophorus captivus TaxID=1517983 RepID=A0ABV0QKZ6_9TELE